MDRAYSVLHVKSVDDEARVIRGVATTPEADRVGDVVEPLGVKFKNPLPLLHQHDNDLPVGTVKFDTPTKDGITFEATLPVIAEPGPLKDRVDTAWGEVKAGLVRAVSIGFRALDGGYELMKTGGIRFLKTEVLELSLVTIPANASAVITAIKSIDQKHLPPANGQEAGASVGGDEPPGATGTKPAASRGAVKLIPRKKP
jgi:HK97 family phage prohead protease